jgi:predicted XRE-type DNA-binding protein
MNDNSEIHVTDGSGNVFADLGLDDADELLARAKLGYSVRKIIEKRKFARQQDIADLLGIRQPEVSNLMNGKYHLFSDARLLHFLNLLDQKVILHITPRHVGEQAFEVQLAG